MGEMRVRPYLYIFHNELNNLIDNHKVSHSRFPPPKILKEEMIRLNCFKVAKVKF